MFEETDTHFGCDDGIVSGPFKTGKGGGFGDLRMGVKIAMARVASFVEMVGWIR